MRIWTFGATILLIAAGLLGCSGGPSASNLPTCAGPTPVTGSEVNATALVTPFRIALTGCTMIDYSMPITVGTTNNVNVIVDSGSTMLAVASTACSNCSVTPLYAPSSQKTCTTSQDSYGDGTGWSATIYNDTVGINATPSAMPSATVSLAAISSQSNSFFNGDDCGFDTNVPNSNQGILGLGGPQLADSGTSGYLDELSSQDSFPEIFAIQFCMTGGNIWFGNYDSTYIAGAVVPQYTPISTPSSFFYLNLSDMQFNGTTIGSVSFPSGLIADSGTSISFVPQSVFTEFTTALFANAAFTTAFGSDTSWFTTGDCATTSETEAQIDTNLPKLYLVMPKSGGGTITVQLPASRSYLDLHRSSASQSPANTLVYCPGIAPDGGSSDPSFGEPDIIGGAFMRSQIMVFDRNSSRIGWAPQQPLGTATTGCTN